VYCRRPTAHCPLQGGSVAKETHCPLLSVWGTPGVAGARTQESGSVCPCSGPKSVNKLVGAFVASAVSLFNLFVTNIPQTKMCAPPLLQEQGRGFHGLLAFRPWAGGLLFCMYVLYSRSIQDHRRRFAAYCWRLTPKCWWLTANLQQLMVNR